MPLDHEVGKPTNNYAYKRMLEHFGFDPEKSHHVADILRAIDAAKAEASNNAFKLPSWVKVDERLPTESTHVLATFKNGDIEINWFEGGDWWGTDRGDEPTHWMPLPEPPK